MCSLSVRSKSCIFATMGVKGLKRKSRIDFTCVSVVPSVGFRVVSRTRLCHECFN